MNPLYYCTEAQNNEIVAYLNHNNIGGGVKNNYKLHDPTNAGATAYWVVDYANGSTGHCVAMIGRMITMYPSPINNMMLQDAAKV